MNETNGIPTYTEVNALARQTGMRARFWKDKAKAGEVVAVRLGNRVVLENDSVLRFLAANQIKRLKVA